MRDGKVGLCCNYERKRLHVRRSFYMRVALLNHHLAKAVGAALRRNCPEHIGKIFEAKLGGVFYALKFGIDGDAGLLALNLRLTDRTGHQIGCVQVNLHGRARAIVHRLHSAGDLARRHECGRCR